jgi:hypothetical protein
MPRESGASNAPRLTQYAAAHRSSTDVFGILDHPLLRVMTMLKSSYATAGTGSAVIDLIFSIAKRDVTFFSDTVEISFL